MRNLLLLCLLLLTAWSAAAPAPEPAASLLPEQVPMLHAWLETQTPVSTDLNSVSFADAKAGWAVGMKGSIIATQDGGQHWSAQLSGTKQALRAVCFVTPQQGWVVGDKGTVLHTVDGGEHWTQQVMGNKTLQAVCFRTPRLGWICGDGGTMLRTRNGGSTWEPLTVPELVPLYAMSLGPGHRLTVVGGKSVVYETRFGRYVDLFSRITTKFAPDAVFMSEDDGKTWQKAATSSHKPLLSVSQPDATHLWATGGDLRYTRDWLAGKVPDYGKPIVETSDDGGHTWHEQSIEGPIRGLLTDVHFLDARRGWAIGFQFQSGVPLVPIPFSTNGPMLPVCLYTENGGTTWQTVTWYPFPIMTRMVFLDPAHAWAAGQHGNCMRFHALWEAESCYDGRQWARATTLAQQVMRDDPSDAEAAWLAGLGEAEQGHLEAAARLAQRTVEQDPQHSGGWYLKAVVAYAQGDAEGAREADRRAIALSPQDAHPFYLMGLLLAQSGEQSLAAPYFQRYLLLDENGPLASAARTHLVTMDRRP